MSCKTNSREACIQVITAYILVVKNASGGVSGALYIFLYHSPFSTGGFFLFYCTFFCGLTTNFCDFMRIFVFSESSVEIMAD